MSTESPSQKSKNEMRGETRAYVVGFVLSLIFTFVPYYLVVNKVISGSVLVAAILSIAVWQMIIQLVFFLHLGRGPKPFYNVVFFFATAATIIVVIGASLFIMDNLYRNMSPQEAILKQAQEENIAQISGRETGACNELRNNHVITITGSIVSPALVEAERCDTLTFVNKDERKHEIAFGEHPEDVSYGGQDYVIFDGGRSEVITLNESGNFFFHDHLEPKLSGYFIVTQ